MDPTKYSPPPCHHPKRLTYALILANGEEVWMCPKCRKAYEKAISNAKQD
jgi:rubrerythrin